MRSKFKWIFTLIVAFVMQFSFAQEKTVSGVVSDALGPLAGANVVVKGTNKGTTTNFDGGYTIRASQGDVLVVSYAGMDSVSIVIGSGSTYNAKLQEGLELKEVVVVAYGVQKKEAVTGAISTLTSDVIDNQQVTSPLKALQGTVSGVTMVNQGGQPGTNPEIRIRGFSSLTAEAGPLYVVDGTPYNGNINSISQDQIESITVLKDASSASLYGSRGANGVILITTKRGKRNTAPKINLRSQIGFSDLAVGLHDRIGTEDLMKLTWEAIKNSNLDAGQDVVTASSNASSQLIDRLGYNPYGVSNPIGVDGQLINGAKLLWETDWQDEILRKSAIRTNHSFDISGGDDKTTYFLSLDYLNEDGPVVTSDFERITSRLNVDSQLKDWLKIGMSSGVSFSNSGNPDQTSGSTTQSIGWIYSLSSIYPLYQRDQNGSLVYDQNGGVQYDFGNGSIPGQSVNSVRPVNGGENAVANLYLGDEQRKRTSLLTSGYAEVRLFDFLTYKGRLGYENFMFDSYSFNDDLYGAASSVGGRVNQTRNITTTLNATNGLYFNKKINNHNISLDAITEAYSLKIDQFQAQGTGFLPGVQNLNGSTVPEGVSGTIIEERINSYLGRLGYNYNEKYFAEFSARTDGSTRFDKDVRWGSFYSVGGSWIISREAFLNESKFVNYLKLRASYGELGNSNLGTNYFPYQSLYSTGWNNEGNPGLLLSGLADINIKWEKTASTSIGLDYGILNNRITGSIDYYNKKSIDLILNKPLATSLGVQDITTNIGSVKNSGFEFVINTKNISTDNFVWNTSLNLSKNTNEILSLVDENGIDRGSKRWEVGRSIFDFYIAEWAGVDPADGKAMWYEDVLDVNGNVVGQQTTKVYADATRKFFGTSLPDFEGGFSSYLKYRQFDLNLIFNFSVGAQILDTDYSGITNSFSRPGANAHPDVFDRWQNPGDVTDYPRLTIDNNDSNARSTRYLFDNDYLRLKSLTLGYSLPSELLSRTGIDNVRLFIQADNVLTFQSHKGIDPEQSFDGTTNRRSPQYRTFTTGVKVSF
ncbi:hypothetical protein SY27_04630 [Flavobacterium sp. 316]|uniref:SusC/RagA family TonB-linked outer membrane protein n=1 Tax=Flavobacterium sp. 316 TaxID=1603293 RepID=UPI0005E3B9D9|nr:TonB-dependent receptor [Flavobacterium sp. 316]KIX21970.1 hypothetical protein SY27_04630 [Flavobacterium sp. 316]